MAMNPEIKTRWTAKLREEGRTQTTGMLRDNSGAQCCLDVLCDVAVEDGVIAPAVPDTDGDGFTYHFIDADDDEMYEGVCLPSPVIEWAGLDSNDPEIAERLGDSRPASHWNDFRHKTFPEIADLIDADENL